MIVSKTLRDMVALSRIRSLGRSMTPWGFPIIYLGWAYLFWLPIFGSEASVWSFPKVLFFLVGGASPLLAGVAMAYVAGGPERVRDLWHRIVDVGRIAPKWWAIVLGFWLVFDLLMAGVAVLLNVSDHPITIDLTLLTDPRAMGFALVLSFVFPLVEEIGLRGYYLDELQDRFDPTIAGVINGGTWAIWHTPFVWFPGYYADLTFSPELWWWLPSIVVQTILIVWVYNNTRRSILAVLLFHGMMNFTGLVIGLAPEMQPFNLLGVTLVVTILVVSWQQSPPDV
ncbi:lysostaphin resistance A-like protein (plasmid) [Haloarcula salina]|uniref:CPBP family intramembrane glutamic endopeptidase n=1 Tax=Haloarcula salina TaxID=1429914 RepID=UPI003C6F43EE